MTGWSRRLRGFYRAAAALIIAGAIPAAARASDCQSITELPHTISTPGCHRLAKSFWMKSGVGEAILINADDVTLDLAGQSIETERDLKGTAVGIYANKRQRIVVRNGRLSGFFYGVRIDASREVTIEGMRIEASTFRGLMIDASPAYVRNNAIWQTGGTHFFDDAFAIGIEVFGPDCVIERNTVDETYPVGIGEGVAISNSGRSEACVVRNNAARNSRPPSRHRTFGYWLSDGNARKVEIVDNKFQGFTWALWPRRHAQRPFPDNIAGVIQRNRFIGIDCSPVDFPTYYVGLDASNEFHGETGECSDTVDARTAQMNSGVWGDEVRAIFAVGMAYYNHSQGNPATGEATKEQVRERLKGLEFLKRAAELGMKEARRILPGVTATLRSQAGYVGLPWPE